jgi:hypothetical protein
MPSAETKSTEPFCGSGSRQLFENMTESNIQIQSKKKLKIGGVDTNQEINIPMNRVFKK